MLIAVDFDGTLVEEAGRSFEDVTAPLRLRRGALAALRSLKAAGHVLVLSSSRANLALREDPELDPLVRSGKVPLDREQWRRSQAVHVRRFSQMMQFVSVAPVVGLFDAIDDGRQGKVSADLYIDNNAVRLGMGGAGAHSWEEIARTWGRVYRPRKRGA